MLNLNNFFAAGVAEEAIKDGVSAGTEILGGKLYACFFICLLASLNLNDFLQQGLAEEKTMTSDLITRKASFIIFFYMFSWLL